MPFCRCCSDVTPGNRPVRCLCLCEWVFMPSYLSPFPFTYIISPPLHLASTLFPHFEIICSPNLLPQSEIPVCSHIRASLSLFLFLSPLLQRLSDESGGISVESHLKLSLLSISPNSLPSRSVPIHPHQPLAVLNTSLATGWFLLICWVHFSFYLLIFFHRWFFGGSVIF